MAHTRTHSEVRTPHSVSLKVLRLSKPQLSYQFALAEDSPSSHTKPQHASINPLAALSYSGTTTASCASNEFILSPIVTLPASFGTTHVGETFACTLCVNNEVPPDTHTPIQITAIRLSATMQTPSSPADGHPLDLQPSDSPAALAPSHTHQRIVRFPLREEGPHVLTVTVTYTETYTTPAVSPPAAVHSSERALHARTPSTVATSGRVRTFRKLYQFATVPLLSVRTRAAVLPTRSDGPRDVRYAMEAQLENMGEIDVVLQSVAMAARERFEVRELGTARGAERLLLKPGDVRQVAFLVKEMEYEEGGEPGPMEETRDLEDGRVALGQLAIEWRSAVGGLGSLSTGMLSCRVGSK